MSSNEFTISREQLSAEERFSAAFDRLKRNQPERLKFGSPVSQNNVAKEAGCDPSALRKDRYPRLIEDIQCWARTELLRKSPSNRQLVLAKRRSQRTLKEKLANFKVERDIAMSKLVEADMKILELTAENARLQDALRLTPQP